MRTIFLVACAFVCIATATVAQSGPAVPMDTVQGAALLIGEWRFVQVLGPSGDPVGHIERSPGPDGIPVRIKATGPDITLRADRSYTKRFTPENADTGHWRFGQPGEVIYTMIVPMASRQGEMLRFSAELFDKTWPTDGRGNYLDSSTDKLVLLTAEEMRVMQDGNVFVYRKR